MGRMWVRQQLFQPPASTRARIPEPFPLSFGAVSEFQPLIDQLYREEILRARKQTPQERIAGAFEIAGLARSFMEAGIRLQHPTAGEAEMLELARERIAKVRRMNEWKLYRPPGL